jgi:hypothetical protein
VKQGQQLENQQVRTRVRQPEPQREHQLAQQEHQLARTQVPQQEEKQGQQLEKRQGRTQARRLEPQQARP